MRTTDWLQPDCDHVLVVCDPGELTRFVRGRYPQFQVAARDSYFEGIAALAEHPARGVLVGVDPANRKINRAVAALRKAAGPSSRLVLCCTPSSEPIARDAVSAGADDYLIYPPDGTELDEALAVPASHGAPGDPAPGQATPSWEEITSLGSVLAGLNEGRSALLTRLCRLLADSMRTSHVRIVAGQLSAHVGDPGIQPTLVEEIAAGGQERGRILIGPRDRSPFSVSEAEKLRHYGRLIAHLLDAAERQRQWQSLALIDPVSRLPNRRYLMQALDTILNRAKGEQFSVTVLLFDLDGFKHFNDTYGHGAGDEIIRETGRLFRKHCRQHDIVSRYGGDEFVVVFWDAERPRKPGSKHPTDALDVLRRFKKSLESHAFTRLGPEAVGCITISGGLASFPWHARSGRELIERADEALLEAKRHGKNRIYLVGAEGRPAEEPEAGFEIPSG